MRLLRTLRHWFIAAPREPASRAHRARAGQHTLCRPAPVRRRVARRDIAWCLASLVALQAALAVWIENKPELRDPEYGRKIVDLKELLAESPGRPLFLALGSSRTLNGFRPARLGGITAADGSQPVFFNFGLTAHSPLHQLACFHRLLNAGIRPRWVLVEITPSFLPIQTNASQMVTATAQEWGDLQVLWRYESIPPWLYAWWLQSRAMPWFSHRFALTQRYLPSWVPPTFTHFKVLDRMTDHGWLPLERVASPDEWQKKVEDAKRGHKATLEYFAVAPVAARSLRELLGRCRDLGIAAGLVLTPEGTIFRSWYGSTTDSQLDAFVCQLRDEFGIPVCDARAWVPDACFWDGHHLLPEGSNLYTDRLKRELIGPMVRGECLPGR